MKGLVAVLAALTLASALPAHADTPDQAGAEAAVRSIYIQVQTTCTPRTPPSFQSISWKFFSLTPVDGRIGGTGSIHDANPGLGGPFTAVWDNGTPPGPGARKVGPWDVALEFC